MAQSLGLSRATVGFVLNDTPGQTIPVSTRRRVLSEAARMGYRPHRAAQTLRRGSSKVILFVLPDWAAGLTMQQHLDEAALALDEAGYSLVTCTRYTAGRARPLWELLTPDVVLGLSPFDAGELASMHACGITRIIPAPEQPTTLDDWPALTAGTALQVDHLHEQGHRRIAFAAPADLHTPLLDHRVRTAQQAATRLGLAPIDIRPVDHGDGSAREAVRHWRDAGVTGIAAYNDDTAAAVVGAAVRAGVSVPEDLAVIGHDDTPLAALFVPSISSVRIDIVSLGRHFAAFALHEADGRRLPPRDTRTDTVVMPRESTQAGSGMPHEAVFPSPDGITAPTARP
ncbi:LacI family transcriptional regulator [Streptomyces mirabilis]|uniref:LacI family DNA-binding transcriptional regulator n=1 Tax=Streptomyces mirabilis TaxID=68239 RepID=UPI002255715F|nr:LacI family DNA-binding transcriptional regulator [Streptomyces mirabilis]MCX5356238.1 LacI family transcriptional regulator [Streptomyces mirabilis]